MSLLGRKTREEALLSQASATIKRANPSVYTGSPYVMKYIKPNYKIIFNRFKLGNKVYEAHETFSPFSNGIYLENFPSFDDFKKEIFKFFDSVYVNKYGYIKDELYNKVLISDNKRFRLMIIEYFVKKFKNKVIICDLLGYIPYIEVVKIFKDNINKIDFMKKFRRYLYLLN